MSEDGPFTKLVKRAIGVLERLDQRAIQIEEAPEEMADLMCAAYDMGYADGVSSAAADRQMEIDP